MGRRIIILSLLAGLGVACSSPDDSTRGAPDEGSERQPSRSEPIGGGATVASPTETTVDRVLDSDDRQGIVEVRPVIACGTDLAPSATGQSVFPLLDDETECLIGPAAVSGDVFVSGSAAADLDPQTGSWLVTVDLSNSGESDWNALAAQCFNATVSCPTGQLAIVLDDVVQSLPMVNQPSFSGSVSITGTFTEEQARRLAKALNRGA